MRLAASRPVTHAGEWGEHSDLIAEAAHFHEQGQSKLALDRFDAVLRDNPTELATQLAAHLGRGFALIELGQLGRAQTCFESLANNHPKCWQAHVGLGDVRSHQGDFEGALESYGKAVDRAPRNADARQRYGTMLLNLKRAEESLAHFDWALEANPRAYEALAGKGRALHALGNHKAAIDCLNKALEISPHHPLAEMTKAQVMRDLGLPRHIDLCQGSLE